MAMQRDESASGEPLSSRSLSLDLQAVAYEELGETPQLKRDTVHELRKLISEQGLRCPTDDAFLVKFLRNRKYRVDEAFSTIRKYFRFRQSHRDIFDNLLPSRIMFDVLTRQSKMLRVLEERDHHGRLIGILKPGVWSPDVCNLNEVFRASVVIGEFCMLDEATQVAGVVGVLDLEGVSIKHFRHCTPSLIKMFTQFAQDCYPIRMKGLYITNIPPIFDIIYSVAKLFIKKKLLNRIHFIGRDYEKLHKLIPRERLPEEYDAVL